MIERAGVVTTGIDQPGNCFLMAYSGDDPVGIVGLETMVDSAFVRLLWVAEAMRRRGIGSALITGARKAAHTRGARTLYVHDANHGAFLRRLGFAPTPALDAVPKKGEKDPLWMLDLSRDGIIER
jgi:N-acetylglutamate synthase-like GNAT family acetyltransferase